MSTFTVPLAKHGILTANAVEIVTVKRYAVEIKNRGTVSIFFRMDGTAPTVAGDDTYVVAPGESLTMDPDYTAYASVKMVASAACDYSVTGV